MSIDKSPARLLARAKSLAESIESPTERSHWERHDIDAIGEAAYMLHEKGLATLEDPALVMDWEIQFCKVFSSLAYWRGNFALSWACSERLLKLFAQLPHRQNEIPLTQARAASAASHYARFEADKTRQRSFAFNRAEALFALSLAHAMPVEPSGVGFFGMPAEAYILYEAARHWHFSGMSELSRLSLAKAQIMAPQACARMISGTDAPKFWSDMHLGSAWRALASPP